MNVVINPQTITVTAQAPSETVSIIPQVISVSIESNGIDVSTGNPIVREIVGGEPYEGEYVVIPSADEAQVLPTSGKLLVEDVTVTKIPYWETSNLSGGLTAYIASEVG